MEAVYKNTKINYITIGSGKKHVLFLHGWGGSINSFLGLAQSLDSKIHTNILIDFPPFGESQQPATTFSIFDYCRIVELILKQLNVTSVYVVAHSFGARVAILLCNSYNINVQKLILTGAAGLKPRRSLLYYLKVIKNKIIRLFNKTANLGSSDYRALSSVMKKTFVNIVTTYLNGYAKNIKCETLIIFGTKDKQTPKYFAKQFKKLIPNSEIIYFKNKSHFAYLEDFYKFAEITKFFLKEDL